MSLKTLPVSLSPRAPNLVANSIFYNRTTEFLPVHTKEIIKTFNVNAKTSQEEKRTDNNSNSAPLHGIVTLGGDAG